MTIEYRKAERGPEPDPDDNVQGPPDRPPFMGPPIPRHILIERQHRLIKASRQAMCLAKATALDKAMAALDSLFLQRDTEMNTDPVFPAAEAPVMTFEPGAPGIYHHIPSEAYHHSEGLSKSALDWALISGQHYHYYQVEGHDQKPTAALREGRILHKVVLEFDDFDTEYVVEPLWPDNAISTVEQMRALIQAYNDSLEQKPSIDTLMATIEAHNAKLAKPIDVGKSMGDYEAAYDLLPDTFRTLGEDDKRTASALKSCVKAYNDSLPNPLRVSGGYQAVLESYAQLGIQQAEHAAHIMTLPTPLPLSGSKAEMVARLRAIQPDTVFLDELKEQFQAQARGREVLTAEEYQHALRYRDAVLAHPEAAVLLDEGCAEASLYWHHPETGALLKCRPDWMRPDHVLVDLKFVRSASPGGFARDGSAHNYHIQDAHYCDGYETLTGHQPSFVFIAIEKDGPLGQDVFKPILVGVYYYSQDDQRRALQLRDLAVRHVVRWRKENYWPGHDGMAEITVPPFQANAERHALGEEDALAASIPSHGPVSESELPLTLPDQLFGNEAA